MILRCPSPSSCSVLPYLSHFPISSLSSTPYPPSVTHSDSLCNMLGSKLNSTPLDLQPFLSSKWLSSVITLQPEWETQLRGREEGWQTETWHERRGNAGLIIHTYCNRKKRGWVEERDLGRKIERAKLTERDWSKWGGVPRAAVHSGSQSCSSRGQRGKGNSTISYHKISESEHRRDPGRGGRYYWIL